MDKLLSINLALGKFKKNISIQINHQPDATVFQFIILTFVLQLNMFRALSRPSSGAQ